MKLSNNRELAIYMAFFANAGGAGSSNLLTTANAASDPSNNEEDSTNGFTQYGLDAGSNVFESQSSVVHTGSYAIHAHSNDTPTSLARIYMDLNAFLTTDKDYYISFYCRHVGTGGNWRSNLAVSPQGIDTQIGYLSTANNTYTLFSYSFKHSANTRYWNFREFSATDDGGVYVDNMGIYPLPTFVSAEVGTVSAKTLKIYFDSAVSGSSVPATTDFTVNDGAANAVTNVAISGSVVTLTLTNDVDNGDTVVVSYTAGANPLQSSDGNNMINLTTESVTNNVAAGPASYMLDSDGNRVKDSDGNDIIIP
jgi:uncharacterized repeat protein (TIGR02059 family)